MTAYGVRISPRLDPQVSFCLLLLLLLAHLPSVLSAWPSSRLLLSCMCSAPCAQLLLRGSADPVEGLTLDELRLVVGAAELTARGSLLRPQAGRLLRPHGLPSSTAPAAVPCAASPAGEGVADWAGRREGGQAGRHGLMSSAVDRC